MGELASEARARRVVTGLDARGRSTIVSDGVTETRLVTEAYTLNHLWQATSLPAPVLAENTLRHDVVIPPPPAGYTYMITTVPPDRDWDYEGGYARALAESGAPDAIVDGGGIAGLHETDTVDIVTVISGEVWAVLEEAETLLQSGDTLVQRGTKHTWRNRSDSPCKLVVIHFGAAR